MPIKSVGMGRERAPRGPPAARPPSPFQVTGPCNVRLATTAARRNAAVAPRPMDGSLPGLRPLSVLAAGAAQAQVAPDQPQVEIYVGVRRVDAGGQPRPQPGTPTAPPASAAAVAVPSRTADAALGAPAAAAPPVHIDIHLPPIAYRPTAAPGPVVQASNVIGDTGGERLAPRDQPPLLSPAVAASGAAPAPPNPVVVEPPAPPRDAPREGAPAVYDAGQPARHEADLAGTDSWLRVAAAQFAGTLAALAVALLLYLAGHLLLGRRRPPPEPPSVRVELVNLAPPSPAVVPAARQETVPEPPPVPVAAEAAPSRAWKKRSFRREKRSSTLGRVTRTSAAQPKRRVRGRWTL